VVWGILLVVAVALLIGIGTFAIERVVPAARREMHNDVLGFVYAVIGVAYAVLLGLVVVATWNTLDQAKANINNETNALLQLDWYGNSLPQPAHAQVENLVKQYTSTVITDEWPKLANQQSSPQAWAAYQQLHEVVQSQQPISPAAVARYQVALGAANDLGAARRQRLEQSAEGIPSLLWVALIMGGVLTVGFAYLFGMKRTAAHAIVLFSLALLVGGLMLVINELNYPFGGMIKVGPEALQLALDRINLQT
jgi:hypothetical protein